MPCWHSSSSYCASLMELSHKSMLKDSLVDWNVKMLFSLIFDFKEKKNDVTAWNFSLSYCAFLDFFDIESRGAIVDEAPKAKVDSFSCFLMIRIFFSLQSTSLSILEQELVHSAAFFPLFVRTFFLPWLLFTIFCKTLLGN